ncbi:MAG: hypothetical protein GY870_06030, partial [archaeon]|nr:hypothetical protein [archaeon]
IDLELIGLVDTMTTVYLVLFVVLIVPGMLVLAKRTTGIIRKKALLQSMGYTLFVICGYLDSSMDWPALIATSLPQLSTMPWLPLVIIRIVMISAFVFLFYGFTKSE